MLYSKLRIFFLNGMVDIPEKENEELEAEFNNYDDNYNNMSFEFTDEEFLNRNKSILKF